MKSPLPLIRNPGLLVGIGLILSAATGQAAPPPPCDQLLAVPRLPVAAPAGPLATAALGGVLPWSKIAFQSLRDGNWEIYIGNDDGSGQTRLTGGEAADIHPRLDRGATRIAFASARSGNYDIFTIKANGSDLVQLTSDAANDVNPFWSPDGTRIVFQSYRDGQAELYVMNADGSGQTRLTANAEFDGSPAWSSEGTKIAYISQRAGSYGVWVMNADGNGQFQLANQPYCANPAWSPDGRTIAYDADGNGDSWQELWLVNADGSERRQVYDPPEPNTDVWVRSWSPDGQYVAFTRISFIYFYGNWYWLAAYQDAWHSSSGAIVRLSSNDTDWNPDWQTADSMAPTAALQPLPSQSPAPVVVSWSGFDTGLAGLASYDVQKAGPTGPWTDWQNKTPLTSAAYPGEGGNTYYFRVRARDNAGNLAPWSSQAVSTTVEALPPASAVAPLPAFSRNTITVTWNGWDPGRSGIQTYDVQYLDTAVARWTGWQTGTSATSAVFNGQTGHTYYFRSRAVDQAHNVEAWPAGNGDAGTTLYSWTLGGQIQDNTGVPVGGAIITLTPMALSLLPSTPEGAYIGYLAAGPSTYTATWSKNGYGHLPATSLAFAQDEQVDIVLPPADNLVLNGDMESDEWWQRSGAIPPALTDQVRHTGAQSAMLGTPFAMAAPVVLVNHRVAWRPALAVDNGGTLHLAWSDGQAIVYTFKAPGENWSPPGLVALASEGSVATPDIAVDRAGTVHLVWGDNLQLFYAQKAPNAAWASPAAIPAGFDIPPSIAVDSAGTVHLVWAGLWYGYDGQILYSALPSGGSWLSATAAAYSHDFPLANPVLAVDQADTLHMVWQQHSTGGQLFYANKPRAGKWSTPVQTSDPTDTAYAPDLALDTQGTLHAVWKGKHGGLFYATKTSFGTWRAPVSIASGDTRSPAIAAWGTDAYVVWHTPVGGNHDIFYMRKTGHAGWTSPTNISNDPGYSTEPAIGVDETGAPHIAWSSPQAGYYLGPALATQTADSQLAQSVTIPVTQSTPALSFLYRLGGALTAAGSNLSGRVTNGITPTLLFSTSATTDAWTHRWVNLSPWAGQTVTITFNVQQVANSPCTWAYLDQVSLGSAYADLWVIDHSAPSGLPGAPIVHTLIYGNRGGAPAGSVRLTDTLPGELVLVSASLPPLSTGPELVWELGPLPAKSGPFTVVITAAVAPTATLFSTCTNHARIGSDGLELEMANNVAQSLHTIAFSVYLPVIVQRY